jgi:hypothetical protein
VNLLFGGNSKNDLIVLVFLGIYLCMVGGVFAGDLLLTLFHVQLSKYIIFSSIFFPFMNFLLNLIAFYFKYCLVSLQRNSEIFKMDGKMVKFHCTASTLAAEMGPLKGSMKTIF